MRDLTNDASRKGQLESLFTELTKGSIRDSNIVVSIVMESHEQLACMQSASDLLCGLEIPHEVLVMSNYTQERVIEFTRVAQLRGLKVIIAGSTSESDFLGLITSNTLLPVLEVTVSPSQVKFSAQKAAGTAAAIAALDDRHISERLRKWQELQTNNKQM